MEKIKKTFFKSSNSNKGITLVALVITIVILIILATVSIGAIFGENGLIKRAQEAQNYQTNADEEQNKFFGDAETAINEALGGKGGENPEFPTPPGGSVTEEGVPIPEGFYYVGGTKNDGVVISDNSADANQGAEHDKVAGLQGNQFVWVPVENLDAMFETKETVQLNGVETTTDVYSKLRIREGDSYTSVKPGVTSSVREPDVLSSYDTDSQYYSILNYGSTKEMADGFANEYKEMYESVKKYKGFYIGRYEISGSVDTPTSKAGTVLASQNWHNLKKACMNIIQGKTNTKSTMIYGNQWDETMNWLVTSNAKTSDEVNKDSSSWGNYSGTGTGNAEATGSKVEWSANHIYDLAGNCFEWTQEASYTDSRVGRGRLLRLYRL